MELPTTLDPQALAVILTKFTKSTAVSNRELAAAVHHLAGYFAGVFIKDGAPVYLGMMDNAEANLMAAITELEHAGQDSKGMANPSGGSPLVTVLLVQFINLALTRWLEQQGR